MEILPADMSVDMSLEDAHLKAGISCAGCHGGDPNDNDAEISMSRARGFTGIPLKKDIPNLCGKCHSNIEYMRKFRPRIVTDQVEQYYQSNHGKQLVRGDRNVADCTSCHTSHSILPVSDPRSSVYPLNIPVTCNKCHGNTELMSLYKLKTDQYENFNRSVHGTALLEKKDISAPACNDCHGNHGATPPGVESISHVCGTCHLHNMEYFQESKMSRIFSESGFHSCEQCHGHHYIPATGDQMLGTGKNSVCIQCHKAGDAGFRAADSIYNFLTGFAGLYEQANKQLVEIHTRGMNDIEIGYLLQESRQTLIQLRTLVHTFNIEKIRLKSAEGKQQVEQVLNLAGIEIREYHTRRLGYGFSMLVFVILALALFIKIRQTVNPK
jgi:predicted CXXCH cytochrome family protein